MRGVRVICTGLKNSCVFSRRFVHVQPLHFICYFLLCCKTRDPAALVHPPLSKQEPGASKEIVISTEAGDLAVSASNYLLQLITFLGGLEVTYRKTITQSFSSVTNGL